MRVLDLKVDETVHLNAHIVLGDANLGGDVHHLFLQTEFVCGPVHKGDQNMEARIEGAMELSQALNDDGTFLRDDQGAFEEHDKDQDGDGNQGDERRSHDNNPPYDFYIVQVSVYPATAAPGRGRDDIGTLHFRALS